MGRFEGGWAERWREAPPPGVVHEIVNLLQAYALLTDQGRKESLEALFTDDAVWEGSELGFGRAEGPQAIAALVTGHFDPDRPMMHLPGPPLLTVAGTDEVGAFTWCTAARGSGPVIYFHYEDVMRRDASDRWRFASRILHPRFTRGG